MIVSPTVAPPAVWAVLACLLAGCASPFQSGSQADAARFNPGQIFQPDRYPAGDWKPAGHTFEDVWFASSDGTRLNGWYCPHDHPRAVVLVTPGNAGNVTRLAPLLRRLHDEHELAVLAFDYRGFGKSDGTPTEAGILEDARAARIWLARRARVDAADIVLLGDALGGAVAVDLAAREGARGLILINTFSSLDEVVGHHWPLAPSRWTLESRLNSAEKIERYQGPLLQLHAAQDRVVPIALGQALFEQARSPKRFVTLPGVGHDDRLPGEFDLQLDAFLASLPATGPVAPASGWRPVGAGG